MAKPSLKKIWWCANLSCKWVGSKRPKRHHTYDCPVCPQCGGEDVFIDEELWCPSCKTAFYGPNQKDAGGDWYKAGDDCPECKKGHLLKKPKLVLKPPRKPSTSRTRKKK